MASEETALLTPRQLEVLELVAKGLTNQDIGRVLGISPGTAKVHVSRVIAALDVSNRTEAATALQGLHDRSVAEPSVTGFGSRPSIAVLPFDNLSGDASQDHFVEGLVEDLTTQLAAWRWFPVIARNSTLAVSERSLTVREMLGELGARYAIEGSARREGDKVRVQVQLIDGENDEHLFAEKYDRQAGDVFALQDDIVTGIVATLEPVLLRVEGLRALRATSASLDTWAHFQRGMAIFHRQAPEYATESLAHFDAAVASDATFAPAHAGRALALLAEGVSRVGNTHFAPPAEANLQTALRSAGDCFASAAAAGQRATELDPLDATAQVGHGSGLAMTGHPKAAAAAFERALDLNPSSALACYSLATLLLHTERRETARTLLERAIQLSPFDPNRHHFEGALGSGFLAEGRYAEALAHLQRSDQIEPEYAMSYQPLIPACLAHLGRIEEARKEMKRVRARWPHWNLDLARLFAPEDFVEKIAAGYALAGWVVDERST